MLGIQIELGDFGRKAYSCFRTGFRWALTGLAAALVVAYFWLAFVIAAPREKVSRCVEVKPRIAVCAPGAERYTGEQK